jgi:hypothetical protein
MAEDELVCERPAKMANFWLAFEARAKEFLKSTTGQTVLPKASNIPIGLLRRAAASCRKFT